MVLINFFNSVKHRYERITLFDLMLFFQQLSTMTNAMIPLINTLEMIERNFVKKSFRSAIYSIKLNILAGKSLSDSLLAHPTIFEPTNTQLIYLGEQTGKLDTILSSIAMDYEKKWVMRKKISKSLFYPCIILCAALLVTLGMLLFVIPQFALLFQDLNEKLPTITLFIFNFSKQLKEYGWLSLFFLSICIPLFHWFAPFNKYQLLIQLQQRLPILNKLILKISLTQFARQLALTFSSGLPITEALRLTAKSCRLPSINQPIYRVRQQVASGLSLHQAITLHPIFPVFLTQMIQIGEESGRLEQMLNQFANFSEIEISATLDRFSDLLEPLIMLILGVLIGGLVIGMYLPIFKLGNTL